MKRQYKIREHLGEFTIYVSYTKEEKKFNWSTFRYETSKEELWGRANIIGEPPYDMYLPPMKSCKSLEEAKATIERLTKPTPEPTWHDVEL